METNDFFGKKELMKPNAEINIPIKRTANNKDR